MKKAELLKTEHQVQLKWLDNQMAKIANGGAKSFSNTDVAERAFKNMLNESLITSEDDIEHFISIHLSESGLKNLLLLCGFIKSATTLKDYKLKLQEVIKAN